ncbi:MAG: serine/threonine protein kinase, partial [Planctomycetaceae bacterium]|nr:serine/threonine protein kinase [Planctomycetaceae bacterium]
MPPIKTKDGLKSFLLTSRLLKPAEWATVDAEMSGCETMREMLDVLERRQLLTPLQTGRILKGETDGLVLGRYKLLYRNASGSFARVFRAATVDDNKIVALKLLRERWADDPKAVQGFEREARICMKFIHPNIVPIFDIGNEGKYHFFTMEFVEGGNLRDFMKIRQVLAPLEATKCIYEICSALEYALTLGATHRDLKLTNVLMSSTGVAKLVDFGLAGAENPNQAGTSDDVQRALEYASLERGTNAPRNDPRSDIFFAGAIYYELLTGEGPWPRTADREERLQLQRYSSVRPVNLIKPSLPPCVARICSKMMDVNPSDRYQTVGEACRDLRLALAELGDPDAVVEGTRNAAADAAFGRPEFKLLVVDTSRKRRKVLNQYFEKYAFQLEFLSDHAEALERLKGNNAPGGILFFADEDSDATLEI